MGECMPKCRDWLYLKSILHQVVDSLLPSPAQGVDPSVNHQPGGPEEVEWVVAEDLVAPLVDSLHLVPQGLAVEGPALGVGPVGPGAGGGPVLAHAQGGEDGHSLGVIGEGQLQVVA